MLSEVIPKSASLVRAGAACLYVYTINSVCIHSTTIYKVTKPVCGIVSVIDNESPCNRRRRGRRWISSRGLRSHASRTVRRTRSKKIKKIKKKSRRIKGKEAEASRRGDSELRSPWGIVKTKHTRESLECGRDESRSCCNTTRGQVGRGWAPLTAAYTGCPKVRQHVSVAAGSLEWALRTLHQRMLARCAVNDPSRGRLRIVSETT